ncbi:mobile mystery protein A (plasmid) [Agrobacterium tumefaciens]|nr:mobile mystery protein A [Agrobacterium tumefaciens]
MSVKDTVRRQYVRLADKVAAQALDFQRPNEGWVAVVRKALAMSGAQLARRMGVSKSAIYQVERLEPEGGVTLRQMDKLAEALGCRFVYAIVPDGLIEDMVARQARSKAEATIRRASAHMALEQQTLPTEQITAEIERLANELIRTMPSDFWDAA